jgi:hypothetical protein
MDATKEQRSTTSPPPEFESCEQCGSPVDTSQRYCVVCGSRRKHAHDPAARFLTTAAGRSRAAARLTPARKRRSAGLGTALVLAAIPLAVGLGLLIGRAGNGTDAKLLAALKAQKPVLVNVGGAAASGSDTTAAAATPAAALPSSFPLQKGYAIELTVLPAGSDQAAAAAAENNARAKGAKAVGLISQSDFKVTPSPAAGDYVIFAGSYKQQAAAQQGLARLKKSFPAAKVIAVQSVSSSSAAPALYNTAYGTVHSVSGLKAPSNAQLAQGQQLAQQVASKINKNYVNSQKGLPDVTSLP